MYELNFKHKYGCITCKYEGPAGYQKMKADILFYQANFLEGSAEYFYYAKAGETPERERVAVGE